jgi:hypothetical protein
MYLGDPLKKQNSNSRAQVEGPCSWKFVIDSTRDMLIWNSCGHWKPWWSSIKGLHFYWGIHDLCSAYCWRQQTSSEFWSYRYLVGLDVFQNPEVIIVKKNEDGSVPCKILVHKIENGNNIVINFCIPLGNTWNMVQYMWDMQIS